MEKQTSFGQLLVRRVVRCWDLSEAVPQEHAAPLLEQAEALMVSAAAFGHREAELHVEARAPQVW